MKLFYFVFLLATFIFSNTVADVIDKDFLDKVAKDTFNYFWEFYNKDSGLISDSSRPGAPCSIAAVGFGLTAYCIAAENGWASKNEIYLRILKTLSTFLNKVEGEKGFFYHFVDMETGERVWNCEVSSIDTALFLAGALTAGEYFKGTEIERLANKLYSRVDWRWMLNNKNVLCMGWKPEEGFLPYYWDHYSELIILYALAIGSPTKPIPRECWFAWKRNKTYTNGDKFVSCPTGSLFVYQYSHAWIDFRGKVDQYDGTDYWENSVKATLANKKFCERRKSKYKTYNEGFWGLSACIGPDGYKGYGTAFHDGTVAPSSVAGSIPFLPSLCISTLRLMYEKYKDRIYTRYGFVNGFNLDREWFADECLGIDQGITLLMIENYKSGFVWKYFMNHPAIKKFILLCFKEKI